MVGIIRKLALRSGILCLPNFRPWRQFGASIFLASFLIFGQNRGLTRKKLGFLYKRNVYIMYIYTQLYSLHQTKINSYLANGLLYEVIYRVDVWCVFSDDYFCMSVV